MAMAEASSLEDAARDFAELVRDVRKDYEDSHAWLQKYAHEDQDLAEPAQPTATSVVAPAEDISFLAEAQRSYNFQHQRHRAAEKRLRTLSMVLGNLNDSVRAIFERYSGIVLADLPAGDVKLSSAVTHASGKSLSKDDIFQDPPKAGHLPAGLDEGAEHGTSVDDLQPLGIKTANKINKGNNAKRVVDDVENLDAPKLKTGDHPPSRAAFTTDNAADTRTRNLSMPIALADGPTGAFRPDAALLKKLHQIEKFHFIPECRIFLRIPDSHHHAELHCPSCKTNTDRDGHFLKGMNGLVRHFKDEHNDLWAAEIEADPKDYMFQNCIKRLVTNRTVKEITLDLTLQERLGKDGVPVAFDNSAILRCEYDPLSELDIGIAHMKTDPSVICVIKKKGKEKTLMRVWCSKCGGFCDENKSSFKNLQELQDHLVQAHGEKFANGLVALLGRCKKQDVSMKQALKLQAELDAANVKASPPKRPDPESKQRKNMRKRKASALTANEETEVEDDGNVDEEGDEAYDAAMSGKKKGLFAGTKKGMTARLTRERGPRRKLNKAEEIDALLPPPP